MGIGLKNLVCNARHLSATIAFAALLTLKWASDVTQDSRLKLALYLIGLATTPILLTFAWTGWLKKIRPQLSPWRNGFCLTALVIISIGWIAAVVGDTMAYLHSSLIDDWDYMYGVIRLKEAILVAATLSLTLKRAPRIQALVAGLVMLACWPIVYV